MNSFPFYLVGILMNSQQNHQYASHKACRRMALICCIQITCLCGRYLVIEYYKCQTLNTNTEL